MVLKKYLETEPTSDYYQKLAMVESANNPLAQAKTSSAAGLYQFTEGTWQGIVKDSNLGYSLEDRFDPKKSREVAKIFTDRNRAYLTKTLKRAPNESELYISHFLGVGGGSKVIQGAMNNPNDSIEKYVGQGALAANHGIFYNKDGSAKKVSEIYNWSAGKFGGQNINTENTKQPTRELPPKVQIDKTYVPEISSPMQPAKLNELFRFDSYAPKEEAETQQILNSRITNQQQEPVQQQVQIPEIDPSLYNYIQLEEFQQGGEKIDNTYVSKKDYSRNRLKTDNDRLAEQIARTPTLTENENKRELSQEDISLMERPLVYLANPLKIIGDLAQPFIDKSETLNNNPFPTSEEDAIKINKMRHLSSNLIEDKLKMGLKDYAPEAAINTAMGAAFAPRASLSNILNETINPLAGMVKTNANSVISGVKEKVVAKLERDIMNSRAIRKDGKEVPAYMGYPLIRNKVQKIYDKKITKEREEWLNSPEMSNKQVPLNKEEEQMLSAMWQPGQKAEANDFIKNNHGFSMWLNQKGLFEPDIGILNNYSKDSGLVDEFLSQYLYSTRGITLNKLDDIQVVKDAIIKGGIGRAGDANYSSNSGEILRRFSTPTDLGIQGFQARLKLNLKLEGLSPQGKLKELRKNIEYNSRESASHSNAGDNIPSNTDKPIIEQPYFGDGYERVVRREDTEKLLTIEKLQKVNLDPDPNVKNLMGYYGLKDAKQLPDTFFLDDTFYNKYNEFNKPDKRDIVSLTDYFLSEKQMTSGEITNYEDLVTKIQNNKNIRKGNFEHTKLLNDIYESKVESNKNNMFNVEMDEAAKKLFLRKEKINEKAIKVLTALGIPIGLGVVYNEVSKEIKERRKESVLAWDLKSDKEKKKAQDARKASIKAYGERRNR